MNYREYLGSDHWKKLKAKKEKRTKKQCSICGSRRQIDCHHVLYKNITDVTTADLRWLCRQCHDIAHDLLRSGKVNPQKKNKSNPQALFLITKHLVLAKRNGVAS